MPLKRFLELVTDSWVKNHVITLSTVCEGSCPKARTSVRVAYLPCLYEVTGNEIIIEANKYVLFNSDRKHLSFDSDIHCRFN